MEQRQGEPLSLAAGGYEHRSPRTYTVALDGSLPNNKRLTRPLIVVIEMVMERS